MVNPGVVSRLALRVAALVALAKPAQAAVAAPDFDPATAVTVHFQLPLMGAIGEERREGITIFGLSLAGRFARIVETEAGVTMALNPCINATAFTARTGLSPSLLRARPEGTHWNLRLPLLLTYIHFDGSGGSCDDNPGRELQAITGATGLEATHWGSSHLGFNIRFLASLVGVGWARDTGPFARDNPWGAAGKIVDLALSIGISFR